MSSNTVHGEVYLIQHDVIKFVSYLWQVGGFYLGTPVSSTNEIDRHNITEILLKGVRHRKPIKINGTYNWSVLLYKSQLKVKSEVVAKRNNWSLWFIGELIMERSYFVKILSKWSTAEREVKFMNGQNGQISNKPQDDINNFDSNRI